MKRSALFLLICLMTSILNLSAQQYPKRIVLGKDTVVCLKIGQIKTVNSMVLELYQLREERSELLLIQEKQDTLISSLRINNKTLMDMATKMGEINNNNESAVKILKVENLLLNNNAKKYRSKLLISKIIIGVLIGTVTVLILK